MSEVMQIGLDCRGVLGISGPDAREFLQSIVTNNVHNVDRARSIYAALLSAQGKYMFDFIIADDGSGGFLFDTHRDRLGDLAASLDLYKLRAKVTITDRSDEIGVTALVGSSSADLARLTPFSGNSWRNHTTVYLVDPRLADLGVRCLHPANEDPFSSCTTVQGSMEDYQQHRIVHAVPEGGSDIIVNSSFALESNFEELNAIDFEKGCYVGQELTARTKFRGTVRRRLFGIEAQASNLPESGTAITANGIEIGTLRSSVGSRGIGLIRKDRLEELGGDDADVLAGDIPVTPKKPAWVAW